MTIENKLIQHVQAAMGSNMIVTLLHEEASKGCRPYVWKEPVALEPPFQPLADIVGTRPEPIIHAAAAQLPANAPLRLRLWISRAEVFSWSRAERFIKQLAAVQHRVGFEIIGNRSEIKMTMLVIPADLPVINAAFLGQYGSSKFLLMNAEEEPLETLPLCTWEYIRFSDFYTPPPYSHLLTQPEENRISCFQSLFAVLANLPTAVIGTYQCLFQPAAPMSRWHANVKRLVDMEYKDRQLPANAARNRFDQQVPSADLHDMADQVGTKAHDDKPFFFTAMRVAVLGAGTEGDAMLRALEAFVPLFQHQGRPLERVTEQAYAFLGTKGIRNMFIQGLTYRPGILLNSHELAGLMHIPILTNEERERVPLRTLDPLAFKHAPSSEGIVIGSSNDAGIDRPAYLSAEQLEHHMHVVGKPGMGKSSMLENIILHGIESGMGIAVIDPHGDLVKRILPFLPEDAVDRTIVFRPGDREYIPIWNPLTPVPGQEIGHVADDIVGAFKSFITDWGDRMEHLFRQAIVGLMHLPGSTLRDVMMLLDIGTAESERLRRELLPQLRNEVTLKFWESGYSTYTPAERRPIQHKLSKILTDDRMALMLSQPNSAFSIGTIMNEELVFLADLTGLGNELRSLIGCLLLSLFRLNALNRAGVSAEDRKPYLLVVDEAQLVLSENVPMILAECRKYRVGMILAHQYLTQFPIDKSHALSIVGSTIIFGVNGDDATRLVRGLRGCVTSEELMNLNRREAIVRIGTEVTRIRTEERRDMPSQTVRDQAIEGSRRRYCKPRAVLERTLSARAATTSDSQSTSNTDEIYYDEFA